jgi:hypothetical protein
MINRNNRDELQSIKEKICVNNMNYKKIVKMIDVFYREAYDNYKYGSSHLENWFSNRRLQKLNSMLDKFNIQIQ